MPASHSATTARIHPKALGPYSLDEALRHGAEYADRHYEISGPGDERREEYFREGVDLPKEQPPQTLADRVKARIDKIKEQRAAKQHNRGQGRERD